MTKSSCFRQSTGILSLLLAVGGLPLSSGLAHADATQLHRAFEEALLNQLDAFRSIPDPLQSLMAPGTRSAAYGATSGTFQQRIDHFNPSDTRTFDQRWFMDSSFADGADSPVIFYICGESACDPRDLQGAMGHYAEQIHAHLITLEHRYYGTSQPFSDLSTEHMQFLSVEQALADLSGFEAYAKGRFGLTGKWISVGGSYPGSLSAYYREANPEQVAAALASSAPVQADENFEEYDHTVDLQISPACANAMRDTVRQLEAASQDPAKLAEAKKAFQADGIRDTRDFLYVVADMGAMAVQYGMSDSFCSTLTAADPQDRVAAYANAGVAVFARFGMTPMDDSFQALESLNPDDYMKFAGMRQWMYQSCTEFGYFQVAYHDPAQSVRSRMIDLPFHHQLCAQLYNLRQPAQVQKINQAYYEPLLKPVTGNLLMTNGSTDPWSKLSITTANGNASNPRLELYTIQGGSHCSDLSPARPGDSASVSQAHALFSKLLSDALGR